MTDPYVACFGRKMLEEDRGSHGFDELVATCKAPEVFMGIKLQPNMEKWLQEDLHARTVCFVGSDGSTHPVHPYLMGFLKLPKQEGGSILTLKENANGLILKTFILRIYGSPQFQEKFLSLDNDQLLSLVALAEKYEDVQLTNLIEDLLKKKKTSYPCDHYWRRGYCNRGSDCRFTHVESGDGVKTHLCPQSQHCMRWGCMYIVYPLS